jgi:hypothetical protein
MVGVQDRQHSLLVGINFSPQLSIKWSESRADIQLNESTPTAAQASQGGWCHLWLCHLRDLRASHTQDDYDVLSQLSLKPASKYQSVVYVDGARSIQFQLGRFECPSSTVFWLHLGQSAGLQPMRRQAWPEEEGSASRCLDLTTGPIFPIVEHPCWGRQVLTVTYINFFRSSNAIQHLPPSSPSSPSPRELFSGWIRKDAWHSNLNCDDGLTGSRFLNWSITYLCLV